PIVGAGGGGHDIDLLSGSAKLSVSRYGVTANFVAIGALERYAHLTQARDCAASQELRNGHVIAASSGRHGRQEAIWSLELHHFVEVYSHRFPHLRFPLLGISIPM